MPASTISRAEAVAMVVRYYDIKTIGVAPTFEDVNASTWYGPAMQAAADHCVIQGDTQGYAKPSELLNRAQMVVLLYRAKQNLAYGLDCTDRRTPTSSSSSSSLSSSLSSHPSSAPQDAAMTTDDERQASTNHADPTVPLAAGSMVIVTMLGMAGRLFLTAESAMI